MSTKKNGNPPTPQTPIEVSPNEQGSFENQQPLPLMNSGFGIAPSPAASSIPEDVLTGVKQGYAELAVALKTRGRTSASSKEWSYLLGIFQYAKNLNEDYVSRIFDELKISRYEHNGKNYYSA